MAGPGATCRQVHAAPRQRARRTAHGHPPM